MTANEIVGVIRVLVAFVSLWFLARCWRSYRVDRFREDLFELRNQLFDFAAAGGIDFDHPAYGRLRVTMNSMIRFAHKVSFLRLVLTWAFLPYEPEGIQNHFKSWLKAVDSLESKSARRELLEFHGKMIGLMVVHIVRGSLFLACLFVIITGYTIITGTLRRVGEAVVEIFTKHLPALDRIENQAVETNLT
jgi:hypothetical protein